MHQRYFPHAKLAFRRPLQLFHLTPSFFGYWSNATDLKTGKKVVDIRQQHTEVASSDTLTKHVMSALRNFSKLAIITYQSTPLWVACSSWFGCSEASVQCLFLRMATRGWIYRHRVYSVCRVCSRETCNCGEENGDEFHIVCFIVDWYGFWFACTYFLSSEDSFLRACV